MLRQFGRGLFQLSTINVNEHHVGALVGKAARRGTPDARGRAGDEHRFSRETGHGSFLYTLSRSERQFEQWLVKAR
jgi:hypothetical protein